MEEFKKLFEELKRYNDDLFKIFMDHNIEAEKILSRLNFDESKELQ